MTPQIRPHLRLVANNPHAQPRPDIVLTLLHASGPVGVILFGAWAICKVVMS